MLRYYIELLFYVSTLSALAYWVMPALWLAVIAGLLVNLPMFLSIVIVRSLS